MSADDPRSSVPNYRNKRVTRLSKASYARALAFNGHTKLRTIESNLITASEFRDRTGLTLSQFMKLIKRGELVSVGRNPAGWPLYPESEVPRISEQMKGQLGIVSRREGLFEGSCEYSTTEAHQILSRLNQGMRADLICIETQLHPVIVLSVKRDWARMRGGLYLSQDDLEEINKLPLEGSFPIETPKQLYEVLFLASKERPCGQCRERPNCGVCLSCARKSIYKAKRSQRMREEGVPHEAEDATYREASSEGGTDRSSKRA